MDGYKKLRITFINKDDCQNNLKLQDYKKNTQKHHKKSNENLRKPHPKSELSQVNPNQLPYTNPLH